MKHNSGGSTSTARRKPFVLIHVEQFEDKTVALKREYYLKTAEGGSKLKQFLKEKDILKEDGMLNA